MECHLDGDADRVTIVDRESNILDGDDILYILGFANPNRLGPWSGIVGTQMSNVGLEDGLNKAWIFIQKSGRW